MRPTLLTACWLLVGLLGVPAAASAQDRRGRSTPGIVLDPKARLGSCDVLAFSPDGQELLAVGDDKVVRVWPVGKDAIDTDATRVLRWPIYREQVGAIYAMALSPDDGGKRVAIGGHGLMVGLVVAMDRETGTKRFAMQSHQPTQKGEAAFAGGVTTYIAWSPDGKYTVHGTQHGEVFWWYPTDSKNPCHRFAGEAEEGNWVRLLAFVSKDHQLLVVTRNGKAWLYDAMKPKLKPRPVALPGEGEIFRAELSPDKRWLALIRMDTSDTGGEDGKVELLDFAHLKAGGDGRPRSVSMPPKVKVARRPTSLAFDADSQTLAVGMQEINRFKGPQFARSVGGVVHLWKLNDGEPKLVTTRGFPVGYDVNNVTFRPGANQIAVAGGPNHEVRLFDLANEAVPLSEVRSPGSCLWSVGLSEDGRHLAWRERMNSDPRHPNERGIGDWRHFTLDPPADGKGRRVVEGLPPGAKLVAPIDTLDGWSVEPNGGFEWVVKGPDDYEVELNEKNRLYFRGPNQVPQCYTFLRPLAKGKPPRLAVGHMWGVSVYELWPKKVRLARVMLGHQGPVMAVAPSSNGQLLVSASRDQTVCCWSLVDWPDSPELGAKFQVAGKQVEVVRVHPGSPAWEAGLTAGDRLEALAVTLPSVIPAEGEIFNPLGRLQPLPKPPGTYFGWFLQEGRKVSWTLKVTDEPWSAEDAVEYLHKAGPSREHLFSWRDQDRQEQAEKTTVRQRPLWVFFPTRQDQGNHWLIWRWRDYYYDSDGPEADGLAGLQRSRGDDQPPDFHPLANVGGSPVARGANLRQYHNPGKIWPYIRDSIQRGVDQRRVLFAEVEPPKVTLDVEQTPTDPANPDVPRDLVVKVTVTPHGDGAAQKVARVSLWLGDYLFDLDRFPRQEDPGTRAVSITATVPHRELRRGENQVRAVAANGAGGFGEATRVVEFATRREKPRLLALCVGVSDYSGVSKRSGVKVPDLRCAENDAKALHRVFLEHKDSRLFSSVIAPKPVVNQQATRQAILDQLDRLKPQARPDDWLVLYLSGHGDGVDDPVTQEKRPGSFYYVCYDTTRGRPQTGIQGPELHARLRGINCHKLILMDACHSGDSVPDMVRDLTLNEAKFLVFTACKNTEVANEPNLKLINAAIKADPKRFAYLKGLNLDHGLFTLGLLNTLGHPAEGPAQARLRPVSADEVRLTVRTTVAEMLSALGAGRQTPVFFPNDPGQLRRLDVFCAFPRPKANP